MGAPPRKGCPPERVQVYLLLSTAICTYGIISSHMRTMVCGGSSTATVFNTLAQSRPACAKGLLQGLSFLRHHPTAPFTRAWQRDLSGRNERAREVGPRLHKNSHHTRLLPSPFRLFHRSRQPPPPPQHKLYGERARGRDAVSKGAREKSRPRSEEFT